MFSTTYPLLVTYVSMCDCELCTVTHTYTYLLDYILYNIFANNYEKKQNISSLSNLLIKFKLPKV